MPRSAPAPDPSRGTGSRQSSLREANLALVVRTVLGAPDPLSRAGVAHATGLTRSTVSRLVDDLVAAGLLAELQPPAAGGRGRPATPLVAGRGICALGLQVNATFVAARVVDLGGAVVAERLVPGDFVGSVPRPVLGRLTRVALRLLADLPEQVRVAGAGLALPGVVDTGTGRLLLAPNLGWSDVEVTGLVRLPDRVPGPVRVGNEADLAARATAELAPGRRGPLSDFVYVSGETGIGGAVVVDGEVMRGRHGWAGEIGHVCVDPGGPPCRCGSTGCLEQYAGRAALLRAAGLPAGSGTDVLVDRVGRGDPEATRAVSAAAAALAVALAGVVNVVDIPAIVLGGHLGLIGALLQDDLEQGLRRRALSARWVPPTIHRAEPDPAPGATGAALRELAAVVAHPAPWTR